MIQKFVIGFILYFAVGHSTVFNIVDRKPIPKVSCTGYSIIEFGKAVNCKGDTIHLIRKNGLQVFVAENNINLKAP